MSIVRTMIAASIVLVLSGVTAPVHAVIIDTFAFTLYPSLDGLVPPATGTFTGTVESTSQINLGDLTNFSVAMPASLIEVHGNLTGLDFFSYNTTLDVGTFGFIVHDNTDPHLVGCVGAPLFLSPTCQGLAGLPPPDVHSGVILTGGVSSFYFPQLPTVTLVSSVNTAVPEPSTWILLFVGVLVLVVARSWRTMRGAALTNRC